MGFNKRTSSAIWSSPPPPLQYSQTVSETEALCSDVTNTFPDSSISQVFVPPPNDDTSTASKTPGLLFQTWGSDPPPADDTGAVMSQNSSLEIIQLDVIQLD